MACNCDDEYIKSWYRGHNHNYKLLYLEKNLHTFENGDHSIPLELNEPLDRSLKQTLKLKNRKKLGRWNNIATTALIKYCNPCDISKWRKNKKLQYKWKGRRGKRVHDVVMLQMIYNKLGPTIKNISYV